MKTIPERTRDYRFKARSHAQSIGYEAGLKDAQQFIPVTEEYPPYDEDILVQTKVNIYYGKLKVSSEGDIFRPDLAPPEERVRAKDITAWRPIFYN